MEDQDNTVPSAEVNEPASYSLDSAVATLDKIDSAPVEEAAAPEREEADAPDRDMELLQSVADKRLEKEPDADPEDDFIHGNARTRLRDGTVTTVGELKKLADEAKEYRAKQTEYESQKTELEKRAAQIAGQEQFQAQLIQRAKAVLQKNFPPRPDPALRETDFFAYMDQKERFEEASREWQGVLYAEQRQAQESEAKATQLKQERARVEYERLVEQVPEFKSQENLRKFYDESRDFLTNRYGATDEQLSKVAEAWQVRVVRDAMAYHKMKAEKPKVAEKIKDVPPVQAPARRTTQTEKRSSDIQDRLKSLRKSGSFDEAVSILNDMG